MNESKCPQVVENIQRWLLFPDVYVIGSLALDRYISVPASKAAVVQDAVALFDGTRSVTEISEVLTTRGLRIDVVGLQARLADAGLLIDSRPAKEMARLGIELFEIPVAHLLTHCRQAIARSFGVLVGVSSLAMLAALLVVFSMPKQQPFLAGHTPVTYSIFGIGLFLSMMLHELSHAVAAIHNGLLPTKIRVNAYLVIIPVFLLVIPGLYTIAPGKRIQVWLAGIWGSLTVGSAAVLAANFVAMPSLYADLLMKIAIANALIAAWNLFPFLPTDGYFIATTLMRRANIRAKAWHALADRRRSLSTTPGWIVVYGIISALVMLLLVIWNAAALAISVRGSAAGQAFTGLAAVVAAAVLWRRQVQRRNQGRGSKRCLDQQ